MMVHGTARGGRDETVLEREKSITAVMQAAATRAPYLPIARENRHYGHFSCREGN